MSDERERALEKLAEDTHTLGEGLEAEVRQDLAKAKGTDEPAKRPWWKAWARRPSQA